MPVTAQKTRDNNFFAAVAVLLALVGLSFWSQAGSFTPSAALVIRVIQGALIVITILLLVVSVRAHLRKAPPPAGTRPPGKGLRSPFTRN